MALDTAKSVRAEGKKRLGQPTDDRKSSDEQTEPAARNATMERPVRSIVGSLSAATSMVVETGGGCSAVGGCMPEEKAVGQGTGGRSVKSSIGVPQTGVQRSVVGCGGLVRSGKAGVHANIQEL